MFADRLRIAQFVMLVQQCLEQRLLGCAPHETKLQRPEVRQSGFQRCRIDEHHGCSAMPPAAIGVRPARSRQLDLARAMQSQQQATADGVLQYAVGLSPVPCQAHLLRNRLARERGLIGDELPQESHVLVGDRASAIGQESVHARHDTKYARRTQGEVHDFFAEN